MTPVVASLIHFVLYEGRYSARPRAPASTATIRYSNHAQRRNAKAQRWTSCDARDMTHYAASLFMLSFMKADAVHARGHLRRRGRFGTTITPKADMQRHSDGLLATRVT